MVGKGRVGYGMIWYGVAWRGVVWCGVVWYGMVWYRMAWHGMVWYGMVWHGAEHVRRHGCGAAVVSLRPWIRDTWIVRQMRKVAFISPSFFSQHCSSERIWPQRILVRVVKSLNPKTLCYQDF